MNLNKVILAGNLTRDPAMKYLANGTALCEFGLAINSQWKDKSGAKREEVCFVDCAAFGKLAETINQYVVKGKPLFVDGRLRFESWNGNDGKRHTKLTVLVENFQFIGGRDDARGSAPTSGKQNAPARQPAGHGGGDEIPY